MKRIAIDLAKSVYQVTESVHAGRVDRRKRLDPEAFRRYVQEQSEPVEWVMEACGTAHHWGRLMQAAGHRGVLLHPRYVRAYRHRNKTDRNDCDAILEAARCADMRPVPVKSVQQQQLQQLHKLREGWKKTRVQRINLLRGILREMGVAAPNGTQAFLPQACELIERPEVQTLRARCRWCWLRSASMSSRCASARSSWRAGMPTMRSCTSSTRSAASGCSPPVP